MPRTSPTMVNIGTATAHSFDEPRLDPVDLVGPSSSRMIPSISVDSVPLDFGKSYRTIRYLGNKRRVTNFIRDVVSEHLSRGNIILDLFSGSTSVGLALRDRFTIYSNDIQHYGEVIARALLCRGESFLDSANFNSEIDPFYERNYNALSSVFDSWVAREDQFLHQIDRRRFSSYDAFCNSFPYYSNPDGVSDAWLSSWISSEVLRRKSKPNQFPFLLFSGYFAMGYFSLRQSLEIDSLRYAIESTQVGINKAMGLCALIYAVDECVSSTGHFAQYRHSNGPKAFAGIAEQRKKSVLELFHKWTKVLFGEPARLEFNNKIFCEDYSSLLRRLSASQADVPDLIYADPPYTADHYSRYYHVLETLSLYDYPDSTGRGRYREDRSTSGFSLRSKVADEFENLANLSAKLGSDLLISYTNDGMIRASRITEKCRDVYKRVEITWKEGDHSNQGRSRDACTSRKLRRREYLIYCGESKIHG